MINSITRKSIFLFTLYFLYFAVIPDGMGMAYNNGGKQNNSNNPNNHKGHTVEIAIPGEDRFAPYSMTIHVGDTIQWTNTDSDDHTIVSDDNFTTSGHVGTDQLIAANGGTFKLRFNRPGAFVYYCRFHAQVDGKGQPFAPGPDGGIQDTKGNFGTPMSGVITVLSKHHR